MYPSPKISVAPNQRYGAAPRLALYNNAVSVAKQESRGRAATGAEVLRRIAAPDGRALLTSGFTVL
jgi:hypothetical protein